MRFPLGRFTLPAIMLGTALLCSTFLSNTLSAQLSPGWGVPEFRSQNLPAYRVAAAADGVFVTVAVDSGDTYLLKYDLYGNVQWNRFIASYIAPAISGLLVSATSDGVYLAGGTNGTPLPGQTCSICAVFVGKYDLNGNNLWIRQFGATVFDGPWGISATADGVYVGGSTGGLLTPSGFGNAFVRKYDPNGNELWTQQFGSSVADVSATANGVFVVGTGPLVLSGAGGPYIVAFDPIGNELWSQQNGGGSGVSATTDGVYVVGSAPRQNEMQNGSFVRKYDLNGNELWNQFGELPAGVYNYVRATADGAFTVGVYDNYVTQYDPNGNEISSVPDPFYWAVTGGVSATTDRVYVVDSNAVTMYVVGPRPSSHVSPLPALEPTASFVVQWSGTDTGGPGIQNYTIYVSDNGGAFTPWLTNTTATQGTYTGVSWHTYGFYSIASDTMGTLEFTKTTADAMTQVADLATPVSHVSPLPAMAASPNILVKWSGTDVGGSGIQSYTIYISDNGGAFTPWLSQTAATQAGYAGYLGHTYGFYSIARAVSGNQEGAKSAAEATTQTPATSPEDVNGDGQINCLDVDIVRAAFGTKTGQAGFNAAADVNKDGVVNVLDLALVTQKLIPGTTCQ
jgi:hypothetical protein